jgi:alpha-galactosidase
MGWNSWNKFRNQVSDKMVREMADAIVRTGMRDAGYIYVNIDDTWEAGRDAAGNIMTNNKFPDMKALSAYIHGKGLKLGIYSSPGPRTCAGYEGSYQHEEQDAKTYAAWGIDYLKYDLCGFRDIQRAQAPHDHAKQNQMMHDAYEKMHQALLATGRPIVYSLCQYGLDDVWKWGPQVGGNAWRTTGDIDDTYKRMAEIGFSQSDLAQYASPGHWNDPDMLEVGNGGMTTEEYRSHFSMWAMLAAPLIAGNDLRDMKPEIHDILTNKEVIAVDQDPLGSEGKRVVKDGDLEVWARPLQGGNRAVILFNRSGAELKIGIGWEALGYPDHFSATVRDLWQHKDLGKFTGNFSATVPSHGVVMVTVKP